MGDKLSNKSALKILRAAKLLDEAIQLVASIPEDQYNYIKGEFVKVVGRSYALQEGALPITCMCDTRDALLRAIK